MSEDETLEKLFEKYISLKVHQIYTKKGYIIMSFYKVIKYIYLKMNKSTKLNLILSYIQKREMIR